MRIFYVTNARLPTEKAHGLATIKLCEAFAENGADVTVLAPRRVNSLPADVYEYYRAKRNFKLRFLPSLDFLWFGFGQRFFFPVQLFSFSIAASLWLRLRYGLSGGLKDAVIFSHDHVPLFFASFFAPKIFYDIHDYPENNFLYRRVLRKAAGFAVQTKWKVKKLGQDFGLAEGKIVYWPNGTDLERFDINLSREEARKKLGLPLDKTIALYTGSLQKWKGVETLIEASRFLSGEIIVYIVGGSGKELVNFQFSISNFQNGRVVLAGRKPWSEIPLWLKAADVLVLPNTGQEEVSLHYTSPMKLFEYMASGRPIVASNLPSIREVVGEAMVLFAEPDSPQSFASAVKKTLFDPDQATRRAASAFQEVHKYTWSARAKKIFALMHAMTSKREGH